MKKYAMLLLATVFMLGVNVTAQEQAPPPPGSNGGPNEMRQGDKPQMSSEKRAERMAKELGLTDGEKANVQALFEKQEANRKKDLAEVQKVRGEQKAKFEAERKTQDAELEKIIGTEKFLKLQAKKAEYKGRINERHEGMRNEGPKRDQMKPQEGRDLNSQMNPGKRVQISAKDKADKLALKLGLTDAEKTQLQTMFEKQDADKVKKLAEVIKLREEKKAQFEAELKVQDAEMEKIIGTENFQKFQTMRAEQQEKMMKRREGMTGLRQDGMMGGRTERMMNERHEGNKTLPLPLRKDLRRRNFPPTKGVQLTPETRAAKMATQIGLTDVEKAKVQALFEKQAVIQMKQKEDNKARLEVERKAQNAELQKIIGKEKFQKLEIARTQRQEKMKHWKEKNPNDSTAHEMREPLERQRMNEAK
jgi:predicted RNA-binding protein YlqC (UPF0109 family)